jgi:amidase
VNDYTSVDATTLAERVRKGDVHPRELVEAAIAAIERVNPRLNAVVHRMYDKARGTAEGALPDGPFKGVPFVVKDLDGAVAGEPYTQSCRLLASHVPGQDAEIVARLRRAGLVIVGKTNTPEFGLLAVTEPELRGPTRNPWDPERTPGGSSGGTAAIVAARAVPMGHGGDGGGSIRIPAAACGLFGLKPTRGRNPLGPDRTEIWGGYVQPHVLTRSVRDSAALLDATAGPERGAPYAAPAAARPFLEETRQPPGRLRVAFSAGSLYGRRIHPDCAAAVREAVKLCADLGHEVAEAAPRFDRDQAVQAFFVQVATGAAMAIEEARRLAGRAGGPSDFEAPTWLLGQIGRKLGALDLERSRTASQRLGQDMARFFEAHDVFLCATMADLPVRVGQLAPSSVERLGLAFLRAVPVKALLDRVLAELGSKHLEHTANTMLFNQTGQPAMSVPLCANAQGLPVGVQFAARFGDEATLLRLAAQLEQARPWAGRRPAICA